MRHGRLLGFDLDDLRARVEDANHDLMARIAPMRESFERLAPVVLAFRRALLPEALADFAGPTRP